MIVICLIAIPAFFLSRWFLKKYIHTDNKQLIGASLITLGVTPLIYLALIKLIMFSITYSPTKDFDRSAWFSDPQKRYQMADDIVTSRLLINRYPASVKAFIGEPIIKRAVTNCASCVQWEYNLGEGGGGLGFLLHHLVVDFDSSGKVVKVVHRETRT